LATPAGTPQLYTNRFNLQCHIGGLRSTTALPVARSAPAWPAAGAPGRRIPPPPAPPRSSARLCPARRKSCSQRSLSRWSGGIRTGGKPVPRLAAGAVAPARDGLLLVPAR